MRLASLIPQSLLGSTDSHKPGWFNKHVTNALLSLSRRASMHPIHTLVVVALITSTSYVRLLETPLFQDVGRPVHDPLQVDIEALLQGSRSLRLGDRTSWRWQSVSKEEIDEVCVFSSEILNETKESQSSQHLALTTFVFADSLSSKSHQAPVPETVIIPKNITVSSLPTTPNLLAPISYDSSLAFSVPFSNVQYFLSSLQDISDRPVSPDDLAENKWTMKAARKNNGGGRRSFGVWMHDAWISFVDLIKVSILAYVVNRLDLC